MAADLVAIPRAAIRDLIGGLAGYACYWDGDAINNDSTYISLSISAYRGWGTDEIRISYDSKTDQMRTLLCGVRQFTLSIRVDSFVMGEPGYETCERIRRRFRGGAARELLEAEGLALVRFFPVVDPPGAESDNRPIYSSILDVALQFAVNDLDVTPLTGGDYIAHAPTTGTAVDGAIPRTITTK